MSEAEINFDDAVEAEEPSMEPEAQNYNSASAKAKKEGREPPKAEQPEKAKPKVSGIPRRVVGVLSQTRFNLAQHARQDFVVFAEHGTTREDFLDPRFWSLVAPKITPFSVITVQADDGSFWGEFLVIESGSNYAKVQELRWHDLVGRSEEEVLSELAKYKIDYGNMHTGHRIVRKADGEVMFKGFPSADAAEQKLKNYLKSQKL